MGERKRRQHGCGAFPKSMQIPEGALIFREVKIQNKQELSHKCFLIDRRGLL